MKPTFQLQVNAIFMSSNVSDKPMKVTKSKFNSPLEVKRYFLKPLSETHNVIK